jgi:hypothetical protein
MYSGVATVMSREFRSARDEWNILSFQHGIRGRGNFFIGNTPKEIQLTDASTRIKVLVNGEFLESLIDYYDMSAFVESDTPSKVPTEVQLISILKELVCALDVRVQFSYLGQEKIDLNDPFIYKKDQDTVWGLLRQKDFIQKELLCPLVDTNGELYGYCGLNVSEAVTRRLNLSAG